MPNARYYMMACPGRGWHLRGRANFRSRDANHVDAGRARREWLTLANSIEELGGTVIALTTEDESLTGLPYAAECGHVLHTTGGMKFLLPNMAAPHRQGERVLWSRLARALDIEPLPVETGIWEAQGDIATLRGTTLLFWGGRTTQAGVDARRHFFPQNTLVIQVREPAFNGNMAFLPLDEAGVALVCREVVAPESLALLEERFGRAALLPVTLEEIRRYATNGLVVGNHILAPHLLPERVADLLRAHGYRVDLLEMTELCEKAGGASRCLVSEFGADQSLRDRIPEENRLETVRRQIMESA